MQNVKVRRKTHSKEERKPILVRVTFDNGSNAIEEVTAKSKLSAIITVLMRFRVDAEKNPEKALTMRVEAAYKRVKNENEEG